MSVKNKPDAMRSALSTVFQPGGPLAPIHDKTDYEKGISAVPTQQRSLLDELTRHADMCQFCSEQGIEIPAHVVNAVRALHELPEENQVAEMQRINQQLMEHLHNECEDFGLRM